MFHAETWRPVPAYATHAFERDQDIAQAAHEAGIAQMARDAAHAHMQKLLEEQGIRTPEPPRTPEPAEDDEPVEGDEHWIPGFDDLPDYLQDGDDR